MVMADLFAQIILHSLMHNGKMDRDMDTFDILIIMVNAINMNIKMVIK